MRKRAVSQQVELLEAPKTIKTGGPPHKKPRGERILALEAAECAENSSGSPVDFSSFVQSQIKEMTRKPGRLGFGYTMLTLESFRWVHHFNTKKL